MYESIKNKLQNILNQLSSGRQTTQLVNSAGTEIGTIATPIQTNIAAGEIHIGSIGGNTSVIDVTFSGNAAAYVAGDVIGTTQTITNAMRVE